MFNSSSMRGRLSSVARFLSRRTSSVTRASRKNPVRLHLEGLEGRTAPAIFVVTNTLDDGRAGSLRWAITQANADADPLSTINFNIAPSGMQKAYDGHRQSRLTLGLKIPNNRSARS